MYPALRDGDVVSVDLRAYEDAAPVPGDVVLASHPFKPGVRMLKRVVALTEDGRFVVHGDDPLESSDSRGFGPLPRAAILGRVLLS